MESVVSDTSRKRRKSSSSTHSHSEECFAIGDLAVVYGLCKQPEKNGTLVRVCGERSSVTNRYPVLVLSSFSIDGRRSSDSKKTREIAGLAARNLRPASAVDLISVGSRRQPCNVARFCAVKVLQSNSEILMSPELTQLRYDLKHVFEGHCIYIPRFFSTALLPSMNGGKEMKIVDMLKQELRQYSATVISSDHPDSSLSSSSKLTSDPRSGRRHHKNDHSHSHSSIDSTLDPSIAAGMCHWSRHLKHENPEFSATFNAIIDHLSDYFDTEPLATRLNWYPNGEADKPFHHDSHAYCKDVDMKEDITIGASFGASRALAFLHPPSGEQFSVPQKDGDIFAFTSLVNSKFQHGVPKSKHKIGERFSIIVWGKRRRFTERNSGLSERGDLT